jgi:hypothetical protein
MADEQNSPDHLTEGELPDINDLFDFDTASGEANDHSPRVEEGDTADEEEDIQVNKEIPIAVEEAYDDPSDDDGLYDETVNPVRDIVEEEDFEEEEDGVLMADGVRQWKVDHSIGDHKLRRKYNGVSLG